MYIKLRSFWLIFEVRTTLASVSLAEQIIQRATDQILVVPQFELKTWINNDSGSETANETSAETATATATTTGAATKTATITTTISLLSEEDYQLSLEEINENWRRHCEEDVFNPESSSNRFEFWVCGIILNGIGILGILCNIISMIILSRPQMRSSINCLLIGLASCDTVLIVTSMLLFGIPSIYPYSGLLFYYYNNIYPFISPAIFPLAMIAQTSSIYMTFTITLERYVAVCHPLKARRLCTYGRAKIYTIICIVFAIIYNITRFFEVLTITSLSLNEPYRLLHCVRPSSLRQNPIYINIYIHWCYLIVNYIIPFLTLAILNCLIYRQVKKANRERQRLTRSEKREIGLATMLLCVVIVFFILNFLPLVLNILEAFYNIIEHSLTKISNLLITINSSCNFLIYVTFGEKFKRLFLLIICNRPRRHRTDQPDLIHYESSLSNNCDGGYSHRTSSIRYPHPHTSLQNTLPSASSPNSNTSITASGRTLCSLRDNSIRYIPNHSSLSYTNSNFNGFQRDRFPINCDNSSTIAIQLKRPRSPSPGPVVYYPARDLRKTHS